MFASITQSLTDAIANHGVVAVFVLMALDALLPVGGELIMVAAGAIAAGAITADPTLAGSHLGPGLATYLVMALSGTVGYVAGAWGGWLVGHRGGREFLRRHGRLVHLGPSRVERAEGWFTKHGGRAVFLGRLTPLVRSFISIPAGVFGEPIGRYLALTTLGSAIWCFGFAGIGWALGSSYKSADQVTHVFEAALIVGLVVAAGVLWRRGRGRSAVVDELGSTSEVERSGRQVDGAPNDHLRP
jgi:membrane protein DedA with SNARE-associated domain